MRIQQKIRRCKFEQILYFCKESPSYENNIGNPSQQRIWLVAQQRHAAKHSDNTSLVTGDPSFMLVSHNIPHYHCSRCLVSPFKKGRDLWNNEYVFTWLSWKTIGEHIKETDLPTLFIALLTCKLV